MKVILQKDIPNLGDAGDVKEVAEGYARNFLLPKKLVIPYSAVSSKIIEHQNKLIRIKKDKRKSQSENLAGSINGLELAFTAQAGEEGKLFGAITAMDIAAELSARGFSIDKRKIHLENPIKQVGESEVSIKLEEGLVATIKVTVGAE